MLEIRKTLKSGWIGTFVGDLLFVALTVMTCACVLEGVVRIVQHDQRPMIPFVIDASGASRMISNVSMPVKLPHYGGMELTTDALGARIANVAARNADRTGGVLFVGDSQVLGWGLPFSQTAASLLAAHLDIPQERVRILASPSDDPEMQLGWAQDYARQYPQRQRVEVVALNEGNDFEEIYFGRSQYIDPSTSGLKNWLTRHSLFFIDLSLLQTRLMGAEGPIKNLHPEINYSMLMLDDEEREVLAQGCVGALRRLLGALPPADEKIVLIIPQDSQISLTQFDKYRRYYSSQTDFNVHKTAQAAAVLKLDAMQQEIISQLQSYNVKVVPLEAPLRDAIGQAGLIDDTSHHLRASGQVIEADALLRAVE